MDLLSGMRAGDRFGEALAGGDFDGTTFTDLAIGIPFGDVPGARDGGQVLVLFGQEGVGLALGGFRIFNETELNAQGLVGFRAEAGARFGTALAAGDFDGDLSDDLAIGVPLRNLVVGTRVQSQAGAVWVIHGPVDRTATVQFWSQSVVFPGSTAANEANGTGSPVELGDRFGAALAAGDFNGDALKDLAIGAPDEDIRVSQGDVVDAGAVIVLYSSARGLSISQRAPDLWHQGRFGAGDAELSDRFGASLSAWNFGRNEEVLRADLAIGVPFEDLPVSDQLVEDCGQVNVLYGSSINNGLATANVQRWHQGSHVNLGGRETGDGFGSAVY
jgi:hypothetical protein